MKKKMIVALLCSLVVSSLTGCGKTRVDKTAEAYEEYGFTKEEARELAELENEFYEENKEWEEQYAKQVAEEEALAQEAEDSFRLCEVSDEIKNSTVYDEIVQVGDIVLPNDGSLTVKDVVERLSVQGPVTVYEGDDEITADSLVNPTNMYLGSYTIRDEYNNDLCSVNYVNLSEDIANAFDCIVADISYPIYSSPNILNFFYPGNICPAVFNASSDVRALSAYEQRVSEYKEMTYQSIEEDLKSLGAKNISFLSDTYLKIYKYEFSVYSKKPVYQKAGQEPYYRKTSYSFFVDLNTAKISSFGTTSQYNSADAISMELTDLSLITPEVTTQLEEYVNEEFTKSFEDLADESVEIVGYYTVEGFYGDECMAVCLTDRGTYEPIKFSLLEYFDGSLGVSNNISTSYDATCSSLEELFANEEIDNSKYIAIK